ncbi:glycosyltransferase family 2 protein [Palleronia abyssalis]|uniref:Mycofactocin biosynthesis glycosyltransferase MftF n=1 Tax=Palleronia abyssalis TaxID=1501240 RepID=A0A2R8BTN3_9RHOB|nr:glycosyltransferase [Palleronia abyssalis]SPJ23488.1 Putative mycofactocin biosynthesis glycosyltransferase MftF [Palleronia abyssalis]
MPRAAIIIPHRDDPIRLERCLDALLPIARDIEICVVDNGSTSDLTSLRDRFRAVQFVDEPIPGAAAARNRGVKATSAPLLFFLDCDCVPDVGWTTRALSAAAKADIVGGRVSVFAEAGSKLSGAAAFEIVFAFDNRRYVETMNFSVTANLLTTRAVFDAVGPFRDGVSEDVDWCHRAVAAGYRLSYDPELAVSHPARCDWAALSGKWRRTTQEAFGLSRRHPARWLAKALVLPVSALVHAPRVIRSRELSSLRSRGLGLVTLFGIRCARSFWMVRLALGRAI